MRRPGLLSGGRNHFALLMLAMQVMRIGVDKIPPVTLALFAGMLALYYNVLSMALPSVASICLIPAAVLFRFELSRLVTSVFFHADDMHIYYNMSSLLYKGRYLERRLGSLRFALLTSLFVLLSTSIHSVLALVLARASPQHGAALNACAVGFSGVLFAYKVVAQHDAPGSDLIMGMVPLPSKHVYWAELLLISILSPNASFLGHLSGIIAGLLYTRTPLQALVDSLANSLSGPHHVHNDDDLEHEVARPHVAPRGFQNFGGGRVEPAPDLGHQPPAQPYYRAVPVARAPSARALPRAHEAEAAEVLQESAETRRQRALQAAEARHRR